MPLINHTLMVLPLKDKALAIQFFKGLTGKLTSTISSLGVDSGKYSSELGDVTIDGTVWFSPLVMESDHISESTLRRVQMVVIITDSSDVKTLELLTQKVMGINAVISKSTEPAISQLRIGVIASNPDSAIALNLSVFDQLNALPNVKVINRTISNAAEITASLTELSAFILNPVKAPVLVADKYASFPIATTITPPGLVAPVSTSHTYQQTTVVAGAGKKNDDDPLPLT